MIQYRKWNTPHISTRDLCIAHLHTHTLLTSLFWHSSLHGAFPFPRFHVYVHVLEPTLKLDSVWEWRHVIIYVSQYDLFYLTHWAYSICLFLSIDYFIHPLFIVYIPLLCSHLDSWDYVEIKADTSLQSLNSCAHSLSLQHRLFWILVVMTVWNYHVVYTERRQDSGPVKSARIKQGKRDVPRLS